MVATVPDSQMCWTFDIFFFCFSSPRVTTLSPCGFRMKLRPVRNGEISASWRRSKIRSSIKSVFTASVSATCARTWDFWISVLFLKYWFLHTFGVLKFPACASHWCLEDSQTSRSLVHMQSSTTIKILNDAQAESYAVVWSLAYMSYMAYSSNLSCCSPADLVRCQIGQQTRAMGLARLIPQAPETRPVWGRNDWKETKKMKRCHEFSLCSPIFFRANVTKLRTLFRRTFARHATMLPDKGEKQCL